ncbi:hypothetical protein CEB3_c18190 [Peptococcaceae bacterium CEB3]|nr:hypothetical protein CEB3_c18190 [Peptococcaceae bacterium CEB3]
MTQLARLLQDLGSVLIAYSGGVDSTFLLKVAHDTLGPKCLGVTAASETYPEGELTAAIENARFIGASHQIIRTEELTDPHFTSNPLDRCYYCKSELFGKLKRIAQTEGYAFVLDGTNADDVQDYRPGLKAGQRLGVCSPLKEIGFTKKEIRQFSLELGLPTWNKPSLACLSSRIPYGEDITIEKLTRVDRAEAFVRSLGFRDSRVRHHGNIARIEIPRHELPRIIDQPADLIVTALKRLGFVYITLDLEGLRSGSMNEAFEDSREEGTK